ncbi:hypothetical protein PHISP_04796 [Aspergillus sp. HF37]|nr:hypothetical protein PHISP_04796 [Aspergillus sp. HF37]
MKGLWVDDYATLSSSILEIGYAALAVVQTRWGQALAPAYFPPENAVPFSKVQYAGGPIYTLALLGFKLALLTSYLRIAGFVNTYRYTTYVVMALVTCNQFIFTFVITLACHPVSKQWNPSKPGWCINTVASYYAIAGTSLGFDLVIIILPLPVLFKLQLKLKQKVVLCSLFALGFFITAIQIVRIFTISSLKTYTDSQAIVLWSNIEIGLGVSVHHRGPYAAILTSQVIVTCVPTYAPLFAAFSSKVGSYRSRQRDQSYRLGSAHRLTGGSGVQRHLKKSKSWKYNLHGDDEPLHEATITASRDRNSTSAAASEEHILPQEAEGASDASGDPFRIHATTEVRVESYYHNSNDRVER